ncbi:uncharacterized protein LOC9647865 [Selaginella moellendorffii]|uniref:uncharacterized protein LOC9647865 n=1 Tax=Selaginella moellendorffii TaxID=88036 RepID=UPI000D1CBB61|nr:uncharacterized protein LOC9647865 [Selaginella moellendorffii]|eukprot:XP_024541078.1 uncharacterized protein LOC9647865 [Selaginella moellendorffii]
MALLGMSTEEYTWLFQQFQLPMEERNTKAILTKHLEEVLRLHGVRSKLIFRSKGQMLEALDNTRMMSMMRSTVGSVEIAGAPINAKADLKALKWSDGKILEVAKLEPPQRAPIDPMEQNPPEA